jgi:hypothetical protein
VRARHHAAELHLGERPLGRVDEAEDLGLDGVVGGLDAELDEDRGVLEALLFLEDLVDRQLELRPLLADLLRALLVVPEPWARAVGLERGEAVGLAVEVKDAPGARRGAPSSC